MRKLGKRYGKVDPRIQSPMEVAALIVGIVSAATLVATLLLVARQTRSLAMQTELAKQASDAQRHRRRDTGLQSVYSIFIEHPDLQPYFYDGARLSGSDASGDRELAVRVVTVAEAMANTLERMLHATRSLGAPDHTAWEDSVDYYLLMSPALREMIVSHPSWWPTLNERRLLLGSVTPAGNA